MVALVRGRSFDGEAVIFLFELVVVGRELGELEQDLIRELLHDMAEAF